MLCPNCASDNRDTAKFCDQCGFPLETATDGDEALIPPAEDDVATEVEAVGVEESEEDTGQAVDEAAAEPQAEPDAEPQPEAQPEPGDDDVKPEGELAPSQEQPAPDSQLSGDETALLEYDLAGFDRPSDEFADGPYGGMHDGGTMQMPRVDSEADQRSKDYLASSTTKRQGAGKKIAIAVIALALIAAVAAYASYQAGVWGGKRLPDVVGMTEADATSVLVDDGFEVRAEKVKSDDTEGLVLIMDPQANSRVDEGSEVIIHIATPRTVPDVKGKSVDDAKAALSKEGYDKVKTTKKSSDKKEGTVIDMSPKAGEKASSTTQIKLTIAQPYTVPDVSGMDFDAAVEALKKAGLGYDVTFISTDSYVEGTIIGTEPAAGATVSKGDYIIIQIAQAWGSQLEEAASEYLSEGSSVDINGTSYTIESLDSVAYLGNNTVSYTATARPFTLFFGETLSASTTQTISGTVVFDDDGDIVGLS